MTRPAYRIVVSGASGSGKSTLVRALADELGLAAIAEDMLPIYDARSALVVAVRPPAAPIERQELLRDVWLQTYFDWCDNRERQYAEALHGYVADRWELDLFATWLRTFSPYQPAPRDVLDRNVRALHKRLERQSQRIDLAVALPLLDVPVDDVNEAGLRRVTDLPSQLLAYTGMLGLFHQLPANVLRYTPTVVEPVEKRVADICALLQQVASTP